MVWTILWRPLINLNSVNRSKTSHTTADFPQFQFEQHYSWFATTWRGSHVGRSNNTIRHLHISHNAPYSPPPPTTFCITFAFHFPYVLQPSQEKLKTILMQNFWGQQGALWEMCNSEFFFRRICIKKEFGSQRRETPWALFTSWPNRSSKTTFLTERSCAALISKEERHISDRFCGWHTLVQREQVFRPYRQEYRQE